MPPRFAYWTILVDNQPTAFRAGSLDDIMPTFKRLKAKHPSAVLMWFQNGKLWANRLDAQEALRRRGEQGRKGSRGAEGEKRREFAPARPAPESRYVHPGDRRPPAGRRFDGGRERGPKPSGGGILVGPSKLEWRPKGAGSAGDKAVKPARPAFKPSGRRPLPKPGSKNWRPGGTHEDPRQKYKDAKKAKWTRFKQTVRSRRDRRPKKDDKT